MYKKFIEPFDAVDNGINQYPSDLTPAYCKPYDIFTQVESLNPAWNEEGVSSDERFKEALNLASSAFKYVLYGAINIWLPARSIVNNALLALDLSSSTEESRYLVLETNCPWKEHLFELETKLGVLGHTLYVLYEDKNEGTWRIQSVPVSLESFESRKMLPEPWRGLRDGELDAASGIDGCTFVHRSGFIGGNRTFEGAKAMAIKAIKHQ